MVTHTSVWSDPAWNFVRPLPWWWKIRFEAKKQSQKWKGWSTMHSAWGRTGLYYCQQIVACPSSKTFV